MFELNRMFIRKMGWTEYSEFWKQSITFKNVTIFENNQSLEVMYYIQPHNSKKTFVITRFSDKQKAFTEYKFVITDKKSEIDMLDSIQIEIKSNMDLMRLVKDFEACNEEYKRHFKLNKLLK